MRKIIGHGKSVIGTEPLRRRKPLLFWVALPFLLAGIASEGMAASAGLETSTIRVRYNRAELTSSAGARNLLKRIGNAALESCGASPFSLAELKAATELSRCWRAAVDDAVRSIGSAELNAAAEDRR
jgi:UrcA family protein